MWALVAVVLQLFLLCLLGRMILSWFPASGSGGPMETVRSVLYTITEPVLAPVRSLLPPVRMGGMGLDLSVTVVFLVILVLLQVLPR
jgi:YggT family protein